MSAIDRAVVAAIVFMYAAIPLYGTFAVFDPLRVAMPVIVPGQIAIGIGALMLIAASFCVWGAFRRPAPRRIVIAQLLAGGGTTAAALLGFDPGTGLKLGIIVLAMGAVGIATYGYSALPGVTRAIVIAVLASGTLASMVALAMLLTRTPAALYAYNNGRAVGIFLNPNELAAYLLVVLGLAAGVAIAAPNGALRTFAFVTLVAGGLAFGTTYSRWGFLAAVCGALIYAIAAGRRRTWIGLGVIIVVAGLLLIGPAQALHHNPRDDTARYPAWVSGIRTALAFPFSGIGPLAFRRTYDVVRPPDAPDGEAPVAFDPHSLPLAFFAESGLLGIASLLVGVGLYMREILRTLAGAARDRRVLGWALFAGIMALNIHVLVNTISIWFPLATQGLALTLALAQRGLDGSRA